jgi:hypothetical protein
MRTQVIAKWLPILATTTDASTSVAHALFLLAELACRQSVNQRATLRAQCHYRSASLSSAQRHVMGCCKARVNLGPRANYSFCKVDPDICDSSLWSGPGSRIRYRDSPRPGRSRDRIPVGARFTATIQTGPRSQSALCTMGTGSLSQG